MTFNVQKGHFDKQNFKILPTAGGEPPPPPLTNPGYTTGTSIAKGEQGPMPPSPVDQSKGNGGKQGGGRK